MFQPVACLIVFLGMACFSQLHVCFFVAQQLMWLTANSFDGQVPCQQLSSAAKCSMQQLSRKMQHAGI
jgi:hypothetical protein